MNRLFSENNTSTSFRRKFAIEVARVRPFVVLYKIVTWSLYSVESTIMMCNRHLICKGTEGVLSISRVRSAVGAITNVTPRPDKGAKLFSLLFISQYFDLIK